MRLGTALVVALALAALPTPAPAQVPSGPLSIHVEAVLGEATSVGDRTLFPFNGTATLTSPLVEGEVNGDGIYMSIAGSAGFSADGGGGVIHLPLSLSGAALTEITNVLCTGTVDGAGTGSGRCAISGEVDGAGTWAGRIETRSLDLTIYLQVVCPRCAQR